MEPPIDTTRLRTAFKDSRLTQVELGRRVGLSQGAISQLLNGDSLSSPSLRLIASELAVSAAWLTGKTDDPKPTAIEDIDPTELRESLGITRLQEIEVGYAMGAGTIVADYPDTQWANFDTRWLATITRSEPNLLFVARGIGDSMMPTLLDNDLIIVDRGKRRIDQQDRVWALSYGELGMVKRVRRQPSGRYLIISDNPAVESFEADGEDLHVIGRVIWAARTI